MAVGYTHREEELIGLTSPPVNENLFRVENFDALHDFSSTLVNPLCNGNSAFYWLHKYIFSIMHINLLRTLYSCNLL